MIRTKMEAPAGEDLLQKIQRSISDGKLNSSVEIRAAFRQLAEEDSDLLKAPLDKFVTEDQKMLEVKAKVRLLHDRPEPVLITGPTGTGKELIARAFSKEGKPFIAENCGALPENLVESIFFGHVRGSFTGAHCDHTGLLVEAGEGIIFLDEIGDMALPLQAKFLRAIQENTIRPVGSVKSYKINCRFIAATKYSLEELVAAHKFRDDLYARISTFELALTGLEERIGDIALIRNSMLSMEPDANNTPPAFNEHQLERIYKYNVRAIQKYIANWEVFNAYD